MKQLLLIEPDFAVAQVLKQLLRFLGFQVRVATNVCAVPLSTHFDFVICDLDLLNFLNDQHVLRHLHQLRIPVLILLTASTDPTKLTRAGSLGATCVLKKPISQEVLHAALLASEQLIQNGARPDISRIL